MTAPREIRSFSCYFVSDPHPKPHPCPNDPYPFPFLQQCYHLPIPEEEGGHKTDWMCADCSGDSNLISPAGASEDDDEDEEEAMEADEEEQEEEDEEEDEEEEEVKGWLPMQVLSLLLLLLLVPFCFLSSRGCSTEDRFFVQTLAGSCAMLCCSDLCCGCAPTSKASMSAAMQWPRAVPPNSTASKMSALEERSMVNRRTALLRS